MNAISLGDWGLCPRFSQAAAGYPDFTLARVTQQHRQLYTLVHSGGFAEATVSGRFGFEAVHSAAYPAVGDWVMAALHQGHAIIHHVLERKSSFVRKAAGTAKGCQVVAANIDRVFLCMALNEDYRLRRLERYLSIAWESGAAPVVVLTKADLCSSLPAILSEVSAVALGAEVLACSALDQGGHAALLPYLERGQTVAFIGSSGVGKSTLINRLLGEELLATQAVRGDGKGRHTTTHRELIPLPCGAVVVDTPGMRELGAAFADTEQSFADIEALAHQCRFPDCAHGTEPGCAVRAAMETGELEPARFHNFQKIQAEAAYAQLNARQIEVEKINRMFGGKNEMKKAMREIRAKNQQRF